uniref:Uncharacterized protein n=1 Tax=Erwinia amylovora ATCC BAA-2158 TaxID=889211 RepID=E5B3H9_ERWAM|nr:hypothetical protein predicted by Glimmer/Critica [Erwinia amylovora ATCC BAA-2158]
MSLAASSTEKKEQDSDRFIGCFVYHIKQKYKFLVKFVR